MRGCQFHTLRASRIAARALALALFHVAPNCVIEVKCDRLELNHVYDNQGQPTLDQMIAWSWYADDCKFHCDWFLLWRCTDLQPVKTDEGWELRFTADQRMYLVKAATFTESHTQFDPEIVDRDKLPKDCRRGLPCR